MNAVSSPFELVPLLRVTRDFHLIPHGKARFDAYIELVVGGAEQTENVSLPPLVAMNPMGREHILERLEQAIEQDVETLLMSVLEDATQRLPADWIADLPLLKVGLVIDLFHKSEVD